MALKKLGFRDGCIPEGDAKAADYEPHIKKLILCAINNYQCHVCTSGAFPEADIAVRWVREAWSKVCEEIGEQYELTDCVLSLIKGRTSHARATVQDKLCLHVINIYRFTKDTTKQAVKNNYLLYTHLMDNNRFHYKDIENITGFAQHQIIMSVIQEEWFRGKTDLGIFYESRFRPFSLELLALVITLLEFRISEWSDGSFTKGYLMRRNWKPKYDEHLVKVREWNNLSPEIVKKIRTKMYNCTHSHAVKDARLEHLQLMSLEASPWKHDDVRRRNWQGGRETQTAKWSRTRTRAADNCSHILVLLLYRSLNINLSAERALCTATEVWCHRYVRLQSLARDYLALYFWGLVYRSTTAT
ncbi:hypothetical protein BKA93DRAFT_751231 [Sparassis latifolia]